MKQTAIDKELKVGKSTIYARLKNGCAPVKEKPFTKYEEKELVSSILNSQKANPLNKINFLASLNDYIKVIQYLIYLIYMYN